MIRARAVTFDDIRASWLAFEAEGTVPTIFQTYDWIEAWHRHIGAKRGKTLILAAFDGDEVIGIAPFSISRMRSKGIPLLRILRIAGSGESDYQAFVLAPGREREALGAILEAARAIPWEVAWLSDLHPDTSTASLLPEALAYHGYRFLQQAHTPCPYISLPDTFATYLAGLPGKERRTFRRYMERVDALPLVRRETVHVADGIPDAMATFARLHELRWQARGERGALSGPGVLPFHLEVSTRLARYLDLNILWADSTAIAATYGYDFFGKRCLYLPGFHPDYRYYKLGFVMILQGIRDAIATGVTEYDLLRGDEAYKFSLTTTSRTNLRLFAARSRAMMSLFKRIEAL